LVAILANTLREMKWLPATQEKEQS
jgi:hypothetical protein